MKISFEVSRYSRSYRSMEDQYCDSQRAPLYELLPIMHTQRCPSDDNNGSWTAISAGNDIILRMILCIEAAKATTLCLQAKNLRQNRKYYLERLEFPAVYDDSYKVSVREQSLLFRYKSRTRLFQIIFDEKSECHLAVDTLYKFNLIHGFWATSERFIPSDKPETTINNNGENSLKENAVVPLGPREFISIADSEGRDETMIESILKEQEYERFEILNFQERNTFVPISDPKTIPSSVEEDFSFILPASLNTNNTPFTV